jgi:hypothetical protein
MYIPLTKGSRTLDLLTHLPLLPLVVDYRSGDAGEDNRAILYAIQQRDRIFRIVLQAPSSILHKLTMSMDEPFPRLETLSLLPMAKPEEGTKLILASTLIAPNLRHLSLRNLCLPTGLQLLAFCPFPSHTRPHRYPSSRLPFPGALGRTYSTHGPTRRTLCQFHHPRTSPQS